MRLFKTLAGAAAALAVAAPAAAAEPSALLALDFLSQNDEVVYYLSSGTQQRQDDKVEFWVFVAEKQPQNVDGLEVVGLWFRQQVDCKADTLVVVEGVVLKSDLTVLMRKLTDDKPERPVPSSVAAAAFDHLCRGAALSDERPDAGTLNEAIRLAQGDRSI